MKKQREAVEILRGVYDFFSKSKVEAPERDRTYFVIMANLASYLEEIDEIEESIKKVKELLTSSIKYNRGVL